jgi:serine/threonine protein kinase
MLERLLGVGGMSAIYLARQERPRRQVAVKLLRAASAPSPDEWTRTLARFNREADAAASLDHANILPIYEFGVEQTSEGEIAYIVMPYLADGSLGALLASQGPLNVPQTIVYLEQAGAALDYAHQMGIVHRDVKPSNLLLHPDGRLLLADFGVARALQAPQDADLTATGMTMGTPEYMAPEQIRGERVGPTADVYALGVVAYTLLAGSTPFEVPALAPVGATGAQDERLVIGAILARQLNEPPPPLRTQRAGVSPRLEEAIFWALAKDPTDRPPTAGAFVRAAREGSRSRSLSAFFSMASVKADALLASSFATSLPRFQPSASAPKTPARGVSAALESSDPGEAPPGPDAPTIHELPLLAGRPAPQWPDPRRDASKALDFSLTRLLVVVATTLAGFAFLVGGLSAFGYLLQNGGNSPLASSPSATSQATATLQPTATTLPSALLSVSPTSVIVPCQPSKRPPAVTLSNKGQATADWSATQDGPLIFVNPQEGSLDPGEKQTITLTNYSFLGRDSQGTLRFAADNVSAIVSYTVQGCLRASLGNMHGDNAQSDQGDSAPLAGGGSGHKRKHGGD